MHLLDEWWIYRGWIELQKRPESVALKRAKMMEAIAGRIAKGFAGLLHALGHHLSGGVFVIGAFFFFFFAIHTDRLVIDDRQESAVFGAQ
jgi:hypothetical protein